VGERRDGALLGSRCGKRRGAGGQRHGGIVSWEQQTATSSVETDCSHGRPYASVHPDVRALVVLIYELLIMVVSTLFG
jgi:hypothetical protein